MLGKWCNYRVCYKVHLKKHDVLISDIFSSSIVQTNEQFFKGSTSWGIQTKTIKVSIKLKRAQQHSGLWPKLVNLLNLLNFFLCRKLQIYCKVPAKSEKFSRRVYSKGLITPCNFYEFTRTAVCYFDDWYFLCEETFRRD